MKNITAGLSVLINFFFPSECIGCQREDVWLCEHCQKNIYSGHWAFPEEVLGIGKLFAMTDYHNPLVSRAIRRIKFGYCQEILRDLDPFFKNRLQNVVLPKNAILVPVPLHFFRKNMRGFNQAELFAETISKHLKRPVKNLLRRTRNTPPQTTLTGNERRKNLSEAFHVIQSEYQGNPLILVDDVTTTHTTLQECVSVLKKAGFSPVGAMVFAKSSENTPSLD